jgi:hypothetical protein
VRNVHFHYWCIQSEFSNLREVDSPYQLLGIWNIFRASALDRINHVLWKMDPSDCDEFAGSDQSLAWDRLYRSVRDGASLNAIVEIFSGRRRDIDVC